MAYLSRSVLLSGLLALCLAACGGKSAEPGTTPVVTDPGAGSILSADGTRVAATRVYEGNCAPEGSRGGCHTITLMPDGTFENFLYDAMITGTYTIADGMVSMLTEGNEPEVLTFTAEQLGELPYKGTTGSPE